MREPNPFAELDRRANAPIHYCIACGGVEVLRKHALCEDCEDEERRREPPHDTWEEARGER